VLVFLGFFVLVLILASRAWGSFRARGRAGGDASKGDKEKALLNGAASGGRDTGALRARAPRDQDRSKASWPAW
jgi:hypothetical protein